MNKENNPTSIKNQLIFDFPENYQDNDKANSILEFILNRTMEFDTNKYKYMAIELEDSARGIVAYNVLNMVSALKGVPIYIKGWLQPFYYSKKNGDFKQVYFNFNWKKIIKREDALMFDYTLCGEYVPDHLIEKPLIFAGITKEQIELIANEIYDLEAWYATIR